jgi:HEAT repeat protein
LITLLAWDEVSPDVTRALAAGADRWTGQLVDALLDPHEEFAIRRRIPRILARATSSRAAAGLLEGLQDPRFEVRYRCAEALGKLSGARAEEIPSTSVLEILEREVSENRLARAAAHLLDRQDESARTPTDAPLRYVFTLLALAYPGAHLTAALECLQSGDARLRGTALEYLETLIAIRPRQAILNFIEHSLHRPAERILPAELESLQRSHETVRLSLDKIRGALKPPTSPS